MALLKHPGTRARRSSLCRCGLVVLAACLLAVNVATRYNVGFEPANLKTARSLNATKIVKAVKLRSQDSQRQRLLSDGFDWASPAPSSALFRPPQSAVHAVSAVFSPINLDSESWLYNRPPPSV